MDALGRFRVRRELGSSSYATVYEAHDGQQPCALKVLDENAIANGSDARRGIEEALGGLVALQHPSIVRILDGGEEEDRLYLSMELMQCPTLDQKLEKNGPMDENRTVLFVRQAAQALDRARDLGYFHGNLTPSNVFVVSEQKIKLSDFAIRHFVKNPPDVGEYSQEETPEAAEDDGNEWVTAQELLTTGGGGSEELLEEDFVGLACLMMQMLGVDVPARLDDEPIADYRERVRSSAYDQLTAGEDISRQASEVVRRLLTQGEFTSPGEVVVELASAMLLRRSSDRVPREDTQMRVVEEGGEESEDDVMMEALELEDEEEAPLDAAVPEGLEPIQFRGDPRQAAYTPFFAWDNRRSGKFFVIYEGERLAIGRDPEMADITLMDPAVSRKHCLVSKEGGVITVEDLGSSNGTYIDEDKITSAELKPGMCVRIGATRVFMSLASRA